MASIIRPKYINLLTMKATNIWTTSKSSFYDNHLQWTYLHLYFFYKNRLHPSYMHHSCYSKSHQHLANHQHTVHFLPSFNEKQLKSITNIRLSSSCFISLYYYVRSSFSKNKILDISFQWLCLLFTNLLKSSLHLAVFFTHNTQSRNFRFAATILLSSYVTGDFYAIMTSEVTRDRDLVP